MKHPWPLFAIMITLGLAILACAGSDTISDPLALPYATIPETNSLETSALLQHELAAESAAIQSEFEALERNAGWRERGYFSALEHEAIAGLFFRFVVNHTVFWNELDRRGGLELDQVARDEKLRAHVLALHAGLSLADSSSFLVSRFMDDPVAIEKLNETFYRYEIPAGSYDHLRLAITAHDRQDLLAAAWRIHDQEEREPNSPLSRLAGEHPEFATLLASLSGLHARANERIQAVMDHDSSATTQIDESLRHARVAALGRDAALELGDASYATRSLLFKNASRIKSPRAHLITFSAQQKEEIHSLLRPGDVLLTYTAGYISDVFIPGKFKHGITYVGGADERAAVGLSASSAPNLPSGELLRFKANLALDTLADGSRADLIEAVAEGVKFSNLDQILDTHINRLLVLRPRLTDAERVEFLAGVFSFLGNAYDFRFDFADASRQVCTEVIYRALQGKGGIRFTLTARAGHPTLSADDVVDYYISAQPDAFDLVLFSAKDPDADENQAGVWVGVEGERRIKERMNSTQD